MNGRILVFSGTTEGRRLTELLAQAQLSALVCVATAYGREVMCPLSGIELRQGRMDFTGMVSLMQSEVFPVVVDATHPFATEASANIKAAAEKAGVKYLRLQRNTGDCGEIQKNGGHGKEAEENGGEVRYFVSNEACAEALLQTEGKILLTVGSGELTPYCAREDLRKRLIVRVLPGRESIALCREQQLEGKQIVAMQGPFSENMNRALLQEYGISCLVTKESGMAGGFAEKSAAAFKERCALFVIGNPEKEKGNSFGEVCREIWKITGIELKTGKSLVISVIGIGMGDVGTLTVSAKEEISRADYVFGAKRMLACLKEWKIAKPGQKGYPYYLAEDVLPILERIYTHANEGQTISVAVLFSGDSGFYSGADKMVRELEKWKEQSSGAIYVKRYPGIPSISYLASRCGMSWQDARIVSIHGRGERTDWESEVLAAVRYSKKTFLLVSGVKDVRTVGEILMENAMEAYRIQVGFQLSLPEEAVMECTPAQCRDMQKEGSYILAITGKESESRSLTPFRADRDFIRGKVPMTKAEIRALVICKLHLTEKAVVYDIGSGTGSVAVEIAERSELIRVFAVERNAEGVHLIRGNRNKFRTPNLTVIQGEAPEAFQGLPDPTHVFIGGSGGRLREIMRELCQRNKQVRIVLTAVTMETAARIPEILKSFPVENEEILQLQISRTEQAGQYHLMKAENPVMLCSFDLAAGR